MVTPKLPVILTEADWKKHKGKLSALAGATNVSQLMLEAKALFDAVKWSAFDVGQALRPTDTAEQIDAQLLLAKAEYKKVPPLVKKLEALEFQAAVARNHFSKNKLIPKASVLHADQVSKAAKLLATQAELVQAEFAAFEAAAAGKRPAPTTTPTTTPSTNKTTTTPKTGGTSPRPTTSTQPRKTAGPKANTSTPKVLPPKPTTQPQPKRKPLPTPPPKKTVTTSPLEQPKKKPLPTPPPKKTTTTGQAEPQPKKKPLPTPPPKKTTTTGQPQPQPKKKPLPTPPQKPTASQLEQQRKKPLPQVPPKKTTIPEDSQPESESETGT